MKYLTGPGDSTYYSSINKSYDGVTLTGTSLVVDAEDPAFDELGLESLDITVYYDVSDGVSAPVAQTATITVTGTDDIPTVDLDLLVNAEGEEHEHEHMDATFTIDISSLGDTAGITAEVVRY